jgi:hypothetical protein
VASSAAGETAQSGKNRSVESHDVFARRATSAGQEKDKQKDRERWSSDRSPLRTDLRPYPTPSSSVAPSRSRSPAMRTQSRANLAAVGEPPLTATAATPSVHQRRARGPCTASSPCRARLHQVRRAARDPQPSIHQRWQQGQQRQRFASVERDDPYLPTGSPGTQNEYRVCIFCCYWRLFF